jgi:response regulator RpfG family c-di-GMP phosphodiesterase
MAKVLIVDDDSEIRAALRELLSEEGHAITECEDGVAAMELVESLKPDLLLLDLNLPRMSGEVVASMLKGDERTRLIPVIVLTGANDAHVHAHLLGIGVEEFLQKPFSKGQLLARVRSLLRVKALNDQLLSSFRAVELLEHYSAELIQGLDNANLEDESFLEKSLAGWLEWDALIGAPTHLWVCKDEGEELKGWAIQHAGAAGVQRRSVSLGRERLVQLIEPYRQEQNSYWSDLVPDNVLAALWHDLPPTKALVGIHEGGLWVFSAGYARSVGVHDTRWLSAVARQYGVFKSYLRQLRATEDAFSYAMSALARAAEVHDEATYAHIQRVNAYSAALAQRLGCDSGFVAKIRVSAQMHDVGKLHIPKSILCKPGPLTEDEKAVMKQHPFFGARILGDSPRLAMAREIALCHHEKWDGTGYPEGLRGEAIPLSARIVALADVYDALRMARPYKRELTHAEAARAIMEGDERTQPGHFAPAVLNAFKAIQPTFMEIYESLKAAPSEASGHVWSRPPV